MKFERDLKKMGMIGAADYVVVLSDPDTCLVKVTQQITFAHDAYVQVISIDDIHELYYNQLEYPLRPTVIAVGDRASKSLGRYKHTKVLLRGM